MPRSIRYSPALLRRIRKAKKWRAVAWHEAGHAVCVLALGRQVLWVKLTPGGEKTLGLCRNRRFRGDPDNLGPSYWPAHRIEFEIMYGIAGHVAERLFTGRANY